MGTRRFWTEKHCTELASLYNEGKTSKEIGQIMGFSPKTVEVKLVDLRNNGIIQYRQPRVTAEFRKELIDLYNSGIPLPEISEILRIPRSTLNNRLNMLQKQGKIDRSRVMSSYWNKDRDGKLADMYYAGVSHKDMASAMELKVSSITSRIAFLKKQSVMRGNRSAGHDAEAMEILDRKIIKLRKAGASNSTIIRETGFSRHTVHNRISILTRKGTITSMRAGRRESFSFSDQLDSQVIRLYEEGYTHEQISKEIGCTRSSVSARLTVLRKSGIEIVRKKDSHLTAWLPERVKELIVLYEQWKTDKEIAEALGLKLSRVKDKINSLQQDGSIQRRARERGTYDELCDLIVYHNIRNRNQWLELRNSHPEYKSTFPSDPGHFYPEWRGFLFIVDGVEYGRNWSEDEDNLIRERYHELGIMELQRLHLPHRKINSIRARACFLKVTEPVSRRLKKNAIKACARCDINVDEAIERIITAIPYQRRLLYTNRSAFLEPFTKALQKELDLLYETGYRFKDGGLVYHKELDQTIKTNKGGKNASKN